VTFLGHGSLCGAECNTGTDPCTTTCYHIGYTLQNFVGPISCSLQDDAGDWAQPDNGSNGTITPHNGSNDSRKFYGYPRGYVSITCTAGNGRASATKSPWGG
jgi:hypothetical protein